MSKILLLILFIVSPGLQAAESPLFDNTREPLENEDFVRMTRAGYRFTPEGRVHKPDGGEPVEKAELPRILDELESRQRLEAMLGLNLIFSRDGYKDLPPASLEEVRRIARQNWTLLSMSLRSDLKGYFSGPELEALQKGVPIIRVPRTWLPDDLGEEPPEYDPEIPAPTTLPPTGRPLTVADTMPVTPLPAPWATYPGIRKPESSRAPEPAPVIERVEAPAPPPPASVQEPPAAPPQPAPTAVSSPPVPASGVGEAMPKIVQLPPSAKTPHPPPPSVAPAATPPAPPSPMPPAAAPTPEQIAALKAIAAGKAVPPDPSSLAVAKAAAPARFPVQAVSPAARKPPPAPAPPPPPPSPPPRRAPFVEYPAFAADVFAKFLTDAPYGREAHHLLQLLARHAEPEDKRIALGVVLRHLPAVLIDGRRSLGLHGAAILPPGELGAGKAIIVLHTGPVLARRRRLLLATESAFIPEKREFYASRGLAVPALDATAEGAATAKEEDGDWGRARVFDDGSRRLKPSPEQLAGTLLAQLLQIDARARGWEDSYRSILRARSAQLRLYRRLAAETGQAPRLDRTLQAEYTEWLNRPIDWSDFWVQALSAPVSAQLAPSVTGELEERLRARAAAELAVLAKIGFAPERAAAEGAPPSDEYIERERQARIERELEALSRGGPEARAWIQAEHRFRMELTADAR